MTIEETKRSRTELESELVAGLKDTFPASDAVHVSDVASDQPDRPIHRRPAEIDKALVNALAREVKENSKGAA